MIAISRIQKIERHIVTDLPRKGQRESTRKYQMYSTLFSYNATTLISRITMKHLRRYLGL